MRNVRLREGPVVTCIELTVFTQERKKCSLGPDYGPTSTGPKFSQKGELQVNTKLRVDERISRPDWCLHKQARWPVFRGFLPLGNSSPMVFEELRSYGSRKVPSDRFPSKAMLPQKIVAVLLGESENSRV